MRPKGAELPLKVQFFNVRMNSRRSGSPRKLDTSPPLAYIEAPLSKAELPEKMQRSKFVMLTQVDITPPVLRAEFSLNTELWISSVERDWCNAPPDEALLRIKVHPVRRILSYVLAVSGNIPVRPKCAAPPEPATLSMNMQLIIFEPGSYE